MAAWTHCKDTYSKGHFARNLDGVASQSANCCGWISPGCLASKGAFDFERPEKNEHHGKNGVNTKIPAEYCGREALKKYNPLASSKVTAEDMCCEHVGPNSYGDCDNSGSPKGPGYKIMAKYVRDE